MTWEWDETLYRGSAGHYAVGRMPYPADLPQRLARALGPGVRRGRLLDVGCGPGKFTVPVAPWFAETVGVDADPDMVAQARAIADRAGVAITVRQLRAEELPAGLGVFDVVSFAQSFHWISDDWIRTRLRALVADDGAVVHLGGITHAGDDGSDRTDPLPFPRPPHDAIRALVRGYLGRERRAGRGSVPDHLRDDESEVLRAAGFRGPERTDVPDGRVRERSVDDVVAAVFSLSSSTPALFGDRAGAFERDLRALLTERADAGRFSERQSAVELAVWRPGLSDVPPQ